MSIIDKMILEGDSDDQEEQEEWTQHKSNLEQSIGLVIHLVSYRVLPKLDCYSLLGQLNLCQDRTMITSINVI